MLDVNRYRTADHKIGRVRYVRRDGNHGQVRHGGRFLGVPAPAATLSFELTPSSRLDFRGVSVPWPLRGFHGSFTCRPSPDGTQAVHFECFIFGPVSGWIFRALFGRWLTHDTQAEVMRMKHLLELDRRPSQGILALLTDASRYTVDEVAGDTAVEIDHSARLAGITTSPLSMTASTVSIVTMSDDGVHGSASAVAISSSDRFGISGGA